MHYMALLYPVDVHPRAFVKLMAHLLLLSFVLVDRPRMHRELRIAPCRTAFGQRARVDYQNAIDDLV